MDNIIYVMNFSFNLLNTRLTFAPFSFTIWQYFIAVLVLGLAVDLFLDVINR